MLGRLKLDAVAENASVVGGKERTDGSALSLLCHHNAD